MNQVQISNCILEILSKYGNLPQENNSSLFNLRYLDTGLIDSISVINFIFELENEFNITLTPDDTQLVEFQTISGLASIVLRKQALTTIQR